MPDFRIGERGDAVINYLRDHFGGFFDFIQEVMTDLLGLTYQALSALAPLAMIAVFTVLALVATRRITLTLMLGIGLLVIETMDLWFDTMQSMATVLVATAVALVVGIPVGIWSAFSPVVRAIVTPLLDFMQTIPVFVYLLPTVLFFGIGPVPGVVATIVFAAPPAVRLTQLGIRQVDAETVEAATAFGASRWEVLREVQLPLAKATIMAGVNQVIMLALSMVVVAGLVGGGGLGSIVVNAVQSLRIGASIEGGLAVVILAIYLDRVSSALGGQSRGNLTWWLRRRPAADVDAAPEEQVADPVGATRQLSKAGA
jgi:glycine betaine/proline transport system permease protein